MIKLKFVNVDRWNRIVKDLMLYFLIVLAVSASFCGFFSKWSFRDDGGQTFGIEAMIEGSAKRPFVYRRLLPETAKAIVSVIPSRAKEKLSANLEERKPVESVYARARVPQKFILEYHLMMVFCFLFFLASIFVLRSVLIDIRNDPVAGTLGALLFALLIPFFEQIGGYYYDFPELLFMMLAVRYALRGNWPLLCALALLATVNKESYFFFIITLYPFLRRYYSVKKSCILTMAEMFLSGMVYLGIKSMYSGNLGGMVELHFMDHLGELFKLKTYFITSTTYGLPLGSQMFFLHVIFVLWIVKSGWEKLPEYWKLHAKIATVLTIPLYWLFCAPGELRNLSFLYVVFSVLLTDYIHCSIKQLYLEKKE